MATCLCDTFFDDVARATVQILEYLGCEITLPEEQTCCGQPAFNAGDWSSSRRVVRHTAKVFQSDETIVTPSGSCAAMLFHGALLEFENENDLPTVEKLADKTWELSDYIYNALDVKKWPGKFHATVAFHRSCHTRGTQSGAAAVALMSSIEGLTIKSFGGEEQCCGFGGTFSVTFPFISSQMGHCKLAEVATAKPDFLVSGDMGCLMHLGGIAERDGMKIRTRHFAQILRDSLVNGGLLK